MTERILRPHDGIQKVKKVREATGCGLEVAYRTLQKHRWNVINAIGDIVDQGYELNQNIKLDESLYVIHEFYFPDNYYCGQEDGKPITGTFSQAKKFIGKDDAYKEWETIKFHMPFVIRELGMPVDSR